MAINLERALKMTPYKERKERNETRERFKTETGLSHAHKDAFRAWLDAAELTDAEAARAYRVELANQFAAGLRLHPPKRET
ncbi:MAG: hypothetical protein LC676_19920 [Loktanella sp.]|nr:hypothetical protein [Loktanella sp.]